MENYSVPGMRPLTFYQILTVNPEIMCTHNTETQKSGTKLSIQMYFSDFLCHMKYEPLNSIVKSLF